MLRRDNEILKCATTPGMSKSAAVTGCRNAHYTKRFRFALSRTPMAETATTENESVLSNRRESLFTIEGNQLACENRPVMAESRKSPIGRAPSTFR
ncbi:hypothetical protein ACFL2Q_17040 [Thermodesulfobacteriota bacterium]